MKKPNLKILWIVLIVMLSLVGVAVIVGVLNATIGGGKWKIGWQSFRYNEEGYNIGSGTVWSSEIREVEIHWAGGDIEILVTDDDRYPSLTETSQERLHESAELRWSVDANGKLTVWYRKSGWALASSMPDKHLILRLPRRMAEGLTALTVIGDGTDVEIKGVLAAQTTIEAGRGEVTFVLPESASFAITLETKTGKLLSELDMTTLGGTSTRGTGEKQILVRTTSGSVRIKKQN